MGEAGKLKKELGLLHLFCISAGAMISAEIFILPAIAFAKTGPYVLIAYLISSLLLVPILLSSAELITAMPKSGGIYFCIERSMGPMMGTLGGFANWFFVAFKSAFAVLGIGIFLLLFNPGLTNIQIKLIAIACALVFTGINILGIKLAGRTQTIITVILIGLLVGYVAIGSFFIQFSSYIPSAQIGLFPILTMAGFLFISFGGIIQICGVAEEIKNPARNIPLAMFLAWSIVSLLYFAIVFVTIGVTNPAELKISSTPIFLAAQMFMGSFGIVLMIVAALLAAITTGIAGIFVASRNPMAMGKDKLLPSIFGNISKHGTPQFSILFTSAFIIAVILFLDLENFVKTASTAMFLTYIFVIISLIIMRESKIKYYQPKFRSPFYPWVQIFGIIGYSFLIFKMGVLPLLLVCIFIVFGLAWYKVYASKKIKREYALLHVIERITGIKSTNYLVDKELREILIERDDITEERFTNLIKNCVILDFEEPLSPGVLTKQIAHILKEHIGVNENKIFRLFLTRGKKRGVMIKPGVIVPSIIIPGYKKSDIILVRCKKGITFSKDYPPANAVFITVSTSDEQPFYLHSLMWLTQIAESPDFETKWLNTINTDELRDIILSSWRKQIVG